MSYNIWINKIIVNNQQNGSIVSIGKTEKNGWVSGSRQTSSQGGSTGGSTSSMGSTGSGSSRSSVSYSNQGGNSGENDLDKIISEFFEFKRKIDSIVQMARELEQRMNKYR